MFKTILACSDGSQQALSAAAVAANIAQQFGARVLVLNVLDVNQQGSGSLTGWDRGIDPYISEQCAIETQEAVERTTLRVFEEAGVPCESFCDVGHPVSVIAQLAEREHVDLIVIGHRGMSEWDELFIGSISKGVLRHAPCSVLVVRGMKLRPQKILLGTDGTHSAVHAAQAAVALAGKYEACLTVLRVVAPPFLQIREFFAAEMAARQKEDLHGILDFLNEVPHTLRSEIGSPGELIPYIAQEEGADLVVVGSRGLGTLQSLLIGSVSEEVAYHAPCSVLIVR